MNVALNVEELEHYLQDAKISITQTYPVVISRYMLDAQSILG